MPSDSAAKTQEPESVDESTEEEKLESASSADSIEEEDYDDLDSEDEDESAAKPQEPKSRDESKKEEKNSSSDEEDSSASSDSSDSDYSDEEDDNEAGEGNVDERNLSKNSAEDNIRLLTAAIEKNKFRERKLEDQMVYERDVYDFPKDLEGWREEDLRELWADAPVEMTKPGWDPAWADDEDWEIVDKEVEDGNDPPIAPFYLPYRRYYPVIPDDNIEIANPKSVIEELDRIEEFLKWVSYIFPDGSSYEGTLWDDLAHGKGVYITENGLVRYEGEWLQNHMSGHGVVEVDIPDIEPAPGSQLEAKMRAEGKIISRDFMSPKDRSWLEMDIEDSFQLADGKYEIPFYENEEWVRQFGSKPEKGRYKYAGQWKHGRMHGCGVYEVNEQIIFGRFYFGELLEESAGCDADISTLHAGIAEVAAAKARMFMNKPDGMVREDRGPYNDPQHPYMYEEDDVWMAPGFINQFYEVPDFWKMYVHEVDQEREMWLNSFYKSPLRIPMPAELEYWWSTERSPEFILINKEPEPDPEDPSKLIYTEDPLILHTRTGRLIDYVEDEEHGVRLFWSPKLKDGEDVDPEKVEFLPPGYDEFFGRTVKKRSKQASYMTRVLGFMERVDSACRTVFERLEKWTEEKRKESEIKLKAIEEELELIEEEIVLEEKIEELDMLLKMQQKEEEKRAMMDEKREDDLSSASVHQQNLDVDEQEEEEEQDEESPTSFGSVLEEDQAREPNSTKDDKKGTTNGKSSFASISMPCASSSLTSVVPFMLQESFLSWRKERSAVSKIPSDSGLQRHVDPSEQLKSVHFPHSRGPCTTLRAAREHKRFHRKNHSFLQLRSLARILLDPGISKGLKATQSTPEWASHHNHHEIFEKNPQDILSMHVPLYPSGYYTTNFT